MDIGNSAVITVSPISPWTQLLIIRESDAAVWERARVKNQMNFEYRVRPRKLLESPEPFFFYRHSPTKMKHQVNNNGVFTFHRVKIAPPANSFIDAKAISVDHQAVPLDELATPY